MKGLIQIIGVLILIIGLILLIHPDTIYNWFLNNMETSRIYWLAISARLILGLLLIFVASSSRFPLVIKIFGGLSIFAAIVFLIIGFEKFSSIFSEFLPKMKSWAPASSVFAMALGIFLIYAFMTERNLKSE